MGSLFVQVEVEDATVESLSAGLQSERVSSEIERAVRRALNVPVEKRVMVEPFRNGVVLSVMMTQALLEVLEEVGEQIDWHDESERAEAITYLRAGLGVIGGHGG